MPEKFETTIAEFNADKGIGHVTLNRPGALNALNTQLRADIITSFQWLESHNEDADGIALRAVVLEGADDNFCAGADINELSEDTPGKTSERIHSDFIQEFPVPIIAKIRGYCLGAGLETAMACDFRFAHEEASLGLPEVDLGLMPGSGGVQFISRLANPSTAKEIAMTGNHIDAERGCELGIVNNVYSDNLDNITQEFAEMIASKPPLAIQAIKDSADIAVETGLAEGRRYDQKLFDSLLNTEDHQEGIRAFAADDYDPEFKGR